ncbi:MAG: hypothetical protein JWN80_3142, partial [Microbacteriaceae bacterium]|nr:hypothetical protein [Microbacteriaceae bacterium]
SATAREALWVATMVGSESGVVGMVGLFGVVGSGMCSQDTMPQDFRHGLFLTPIIQARPNNVIGEMKLKAMFCVKKSLSLGASMFHAVCAVPAFSLIGFDAHGENHVETPLSQAHLNALSTHLRSTLIVDGLPGSPRRQFEEFPPDSPDNMTHLTFYESDDDTQMNLLIDLKRDGEQLFVFNVLLSKDNNLLFRGAATATQAARDWNNETRAASNAETFRLRRAIEAELTRSPMVRSASMPDVTPAAEPHGLKVSARNDVNHDENHAVTHGMIHGLPHRHRLTRDLEHGVKRPYPW